MGHVFRRLQLFGLASTLAAFSAALAAPALAAPDTVQDASRATTLGYEVDASLIYFDSLTRPRTGVVAPLVGAAAPARAFGLKRFRLAATWQALDSAGLTIVLRPDAANRSLEQSADAEPRELDTRAGEVGLGSPYRATPSVRVLDAYQISIAPGAALSASFGVFEELTPTVASYPQLLAFGLETSLPAKFSGGRLGWRRPRAADPESGAGLSLDMTVMQGDEDRAEGRCSDATATATVPCAGDSRSRDHAPLARDPYQGAALEVSWVGSSGLSLNLLGGSLEGAAVGGRVSEALGQLGAELTQTLGSRTVKLSLDMRYARERWRVDGVAIRPRVQYSARLTSAVAIDARGFATAGLAVGHSDQDPGLPADAPRPLDRQVPVKGYQIELGYLANVATSLSAQLMLVHERRTTTDAAGAEVGAIQHEDGGARTLRRMGFALTYLLNEDV